MRIRIRNIGKIVDADIQIKGITVIGGKNGTGKSTVSRALFSMFNSFHEYATQIRRERSLSIERYVEDPVVASELAEKSAYRDNPKAIADLLSSIHDDNEDDGLFHKVESNSNEEKAAAILEIIKVPDQAILKRLIDRCFSAEFNGQVLNIYTEEKAFVDLSIKDETISVGLGAGTADVRGEFELQKNAIYIDDPFIIDSLVQRDWRLKSGTSYSHRFNLLSVLNDRADRDAVSSIISSKKLETINRKLDSICTGYILRDAKANGFSRLSNPSISYIEKMPEKKLRLSNLSSGLKTFVLLKMLIENGALEDNGVMIFDEPEIHLHPEWQLVLAELIVLIQKEFDMHILVNTHSPYFIDAIEAYSAKHGIEDKCMFYLASERDGVACFEDVSNAVDRVYELLAAPFQHLESVRSGGDGEI